MALRITCIVPDDSDPDNGIDSVGGVGWRLSKEIVIGEIEDGANYYVEIEDHRVEVVVAERDARKYLRTNPDQTIENNLLLLPHCLRRTE